MGNMSYFVGSLKVMEGSSSHCYQSSSKQEYTYVKPERSEKAIGKLLINF